MIKRVSLLLMLCAMLGARAFADEQVVAISDEVAHPEWIEGILLWVQTLPKVGPYLSIAFNYVGIIAAIFTALSVCAQVILSVPEIMARFSGAPALADKIKYWSDKIIYWLKFFSIRNAKK